MKITKVEFTDLPFKHYSTDLHVTFENEGEEYGFTVSISGYGPNPSSREIDRGWDSEEGMDHVESDMHLYLAQVIYHELISDKRVSDGNSI